MPTENLNRNPKAKRSTWRRIAGSGLLNKWAAPHGVGGYLESINPMLSLDTQAVKAKVIRVQRETSSATSLVLKPNGEWQGFMPGQYVMLSLNLNGRKETRCYSLCGDINAETIELCVKETADGFVSKAVNHSLRVGDVVTISQAMGEFVAAEQTPPAVLLLAAGSGITPVIGVLQQLLKSQPQTPVFMLYYNRSPSDAIFLRRLQKLAAEQPYFNLQCFYSQPEGGEPQRLCTKDIRQLQLPDGFHSYVCGPTGFIDKAQTLLSKDRNAAAVYSERFTAPAAPKVTRRKDKPAGELVFTQSERYAKNNGDSVLEQAEAAGLKPQAGCRMGICHTCTCKKLSGAVRNTQTGEVSHGEEQIRICVSQPLGDVTVEL